MDEQNNQTPPQPTNQSSTPAPQPSPEQPQTSPKRDGKENMKTFMGVLSYVGPLVFVPLFTDSKNDHFLKFHIKQGLVVFSIEVLTWFLAVSILHLWSVAHIINLATFVLSVIGIVNVLQSKEKELPVVGKFSHYFNV